MVYLATICTYEIRTQNTRGYRHDHPPPLMLDLLDGTAGALLGFATATTLLLLWAASLVDLFRRRDLSVGKKAAWVSVIILTAYIGVAFYFAMRPIPPPYGKGVKHSVARSSNIVEELERLHAEHNSGAMTDDVYLAAKQDIFGLSE